MVPLGEKAVENDRMCFDYTASGTIVPLSPSPDFINNNYNTFIKDLTLFLVGIYFALVFLEAAMTV